MLLMTILDLGIVTGIGIEFGWSYDSVENVFEIVNIADLGIGLLFRINIFINNKPNIKYKTYICAIIV